MVEITPIVLRGADERDLTQIWEYRSIGGYETLAKARAMTADQIIEELNASSTGWAPRSAQQMFVQTSTRCRPTGRRWNMS